jgi:two-component system, NarL family, response regulator NreC
MTSQQALPKLSRESRRPPPKEPDSVLTPRTHARARIFVVDEKGIMRDGLCALIADSAEFEVIGSDSSVADALRNPASTRAEVIVVDFPQARSEGPQLIGSIKARLPHVGVLVLTLGKNDHLIDAALRAGADGCVLKNDSCSELFTALRSIVAGLSFVSPSISGRVVSAHVQKSVPGPVRGQPADELTERERQVIRLIAAGHRTREIAQLLSLSHKTIEKHRTSLMRKLRLRNASAVAAYAIARGLA